MAEWSGQDWGYAFAGGTVLLERLVAEPSAAVRAGVGLGGASIAVEMFAWSDRHHGDPLAEKLIKRALKALGAGVASAVNLLDVEAVIIGGGLGVRFGERFMDPLTKEMGKHLFLDERPPAVRVVSLGDLGGAIGASLLVGR